MGNAIAVMKVIVSTMEIAYFLEFNQLYLNLALSKILMAAAKIVLLVIVYKKVHVYITKVEQYLISTFLFVM